MYFQLLDLCDAATEFEVRETLGRLPEGIIETYTRILKKITENRSNKILAQQTFKWIVCAKRPMHVFELAEAVAFKATDTFWNREKIPNPERLYKACGNLVVIDDEDKTVRLVHHTVQQFLLEPLQRQALEFFQICPRRGDIELGEICVAYLSFSDFETQIAISNHQSLPLSRLPEPRKVLEHVSSQPGSSNLSSSIFQVISRVRYDKQWSKPTDFDLSKFLKLKTAPSRTLQERYLLLDYVIQNWLDHTLSFSASNTSMWKSFKHLALNKSLPFDIRPWGEINELRKRPYVDLIEWAVKAQHLPLLQILPQHVANELLREAILIDSSEIIELLLAEGTNVEVNDEYGKKALHMAVARGHTVIINMLVTKGVNVNAKSFDNERTALHWAAHRGYTAIAEVLMVKGTDLEVKDKYQWTALHLAAREGHTTIVDLLLAHGADFEAKAEHAWTALHLAGAAGHVSTVELLIVHGADVEAKDLSGNTALHLAVAEGKMAVVELLIANGADVKARDLSRKTALDWAVQKNHRAVFDFLSAKAAAVELELTSSASSSGF